MNILDLLDPNALNSGPPSQLPLPALTLRGSPQPVVANAPPAPAPRQSIFARGFMSHLLPVGDDTEGLISPQDAADARRAQFLKLGAAMLANSGPRPKGTSNFFQRLGQSIQQSGLPDWRQNMASLAQLHEGLQQYQAKRALDQVRQGIIAKYPAADNETPAQTGQRMLKMYNDFLGAGDTEMTARMSELLPSLLQQHQQTGWGQPFSAVDTVTGKAGEYVRGPDGRAYDTQGHLAPNPLSPYNKPQQGMSATGASNRQLAARRLWNSETQNLQKRYSTMKGALADADQAINGNASAQIGFTDNLLRTFNPTIGLRASGLNTYLSKLPLSQRAQGEIQMLAEGKGGLSPQTIREGLQALSSMYQTDRDEFANRQNNISGVFDDVPAQTFYVPPELDFSKYGQAAAPSGGSATNRIKKTIGSR